VYNSRTPSRERSHILMGALLARARALTTFLAQHMIVSGNIYEPTLDNFAMVETVP